MVSSAKVSAVTLIALVLLIQGCSKPSGWFCSRDKINDTSLREPKGSHLHHILHNGQSLAAGEEATPVATTAPSPFGNLKFERGIATWQDRERNADPANRPARYFERGLLQPDGGGGYYGETIANGIADHLSSRIDTEAGREAVERHRFLFSYHGQGNRLIRELDKRHDEAKDPRAEARKSIGGHYRTGIDDVRRAQQLAGDDCRHYSVAAVTWMQGEANGDMRLSRWEPAVAPLQALLVYMDDLIKLARDYDDDIRAVTGQREAIPFLTYQTSTYPLVAQAQLSAADAEPLIHLVSPTYYMPSSANGHYWIENKKLFGHDIHIAADAERWLGEQFAKVLWHVSVDKKDWQPLRPLSAAAENAGKSIRVSFHVPVPPLALDQQFLPAQVTTGGMSLLGFEVLDEKYVAVPIDNVTVSDANGVVIALKQPLSITGAAYHVRYGRQSSTAFSAKVVRMESATDTGDGYRNSAVLVTTDALPALDSLAQEGVFYLACENQPRLLVRQVQMEKELRLIVDVTDKGDLTLPENAQCHGERIYAYGNLRDSDAASSFYSFAHGPRKGHKYPLHNWSVVFDQLRVAM